MAALSNKCLLLPMCIARCCLCREPGAYTPTSHLRLFARRHTSAAAVDVLNYDELQRKRRSTAEHSVLIQRTVPEQTVLEYCCSYGPISSALSYKNFDKTYTLIEYRHKYSVDLLLANTKHFSNSNYVRTESRFLYFSQRYRRQSRADGSSRVTIDHKATVANYRAPQLTDGDLLSCQSVEEQIWLLHDRHSLSELDIRLRYFLCSETECFLRKLYSGASVDIFGSTVSGFGRFDCDLDMALDLHAESERQINGRGALFFMTKERPVNSRSFVQQTLDAVGGLLKLVMPQAVNIQCVLKARVPIVKFIHSGSAIACDLSIENKTSVSMSEVLFYLSQLASNVDVDPGRRRYELAALVFTVRQWARCSGVTRSVPGPYLSNFMLTLLVVHFLQSRSQPVLPALQSLKNIQANESKQLSDDITLPYGSVTSSAQCQKFWQLGVLLMEFFEHYSVFDFSSNGISVVEGSIVRKPDPEVPLYIENPLDRELNVAKNVNQANLEFFQSECCATCDKLLESFEQDSQRPWGLLTILSSNIKKTSSDVTEETNLNCDETDAKETDIEDSSADEGKDRFLSESQLKVRMLDILSESETSTN